MRGGTVRGREGTRYSRFQVLTEGRPAWVQGARGSWFYFDGMCFWRSTRRGEGKLVTSWKSPSYGWEHESQCSCGLCVTGSGLDHEAA